MKKSSPRERLFIRLYVLEPNATKAARDAGFSKKSAREIGYRLLKKVHIKRAIEAAMKKREDKLIMDREEILKELSIIGRSDLANYMEIDEGGMIRAKTFEQMPEGTSRALESIEENRTLRESSDGKDSNVVTDKIKFKMHDKIRALELLGRNKGMFPNKIEGGLKIQGRLSIDALKKSAKGYQDADSRP